MDLWIPRSPRILPPYAQSPPRKLMSRYNAAGGGSNLSGAQVLPTSPLVGFFTNFWKLDDVNDAIGSLTMTNSASPVTFVPGKRGNGGNFVRANSQWLDRANVPFTGPSFTVAAWFKHTMTFDANTHYMFDWNGVAIGCVALGVNANVSGDLRFFTDPSHFLDTPALSLNDGNWHLVVAWHDSGTGINTVVVDNAAPRTAGSTTNVATATVQASIGRYTGGTNTFSWDGMIDAVGIADNKTPSASQITALWNGGAGVEPPF